MPWGVPANRSSGRRSKAVLPRKTNRERLDSRSPNDVDLRNRPRQGQWGNIRNCGNRHISGGDLVSIKSPDAEGEGVE